MQSIFLDIANEILEYYNSIPNRSLRNLPYVHAYSYYDGNKVRINLGVNSVVIRLVKQDIVFLIECGSLNADPGIRYRKCFNINDPNCFESVGRHMVDALYDVAIS